MNSKILEILIGELVAKKDIEGLSRLAKSSKAELSKMIVEHRPVIEARLEKVIADCKESLAEVAKTS